MICGTMGRSLLQHPEPVRRKDSSLDGYYKNGIPVTAAAVGDSITWDVPGYSPGTVYLVQTVNGQPGYMGPITVPMSPFVLTAAQAGQWQNTVYDKQGGSVIETDSLSVGQLIMPPPTKPTGTTTTPTPTGPPSITVIPSGTTGTTSTSSTTSSTTTTDTTAPPDNTMLLVAAAVVLGFLMLK